MGFFVGGQILIDGDLGEVGAENVRSSLQGNRDQRNHHLHPVRTQVGKQALHQPAVIRFA